jgi:hypothetical protein
MCVKLVIYKDCTEMHVQQNIKYYFAPFNTANYSACRSESTSFCQRY